MRIASRMAGISLQDGEIRIALARRIRRRWCFEDFITLTLPETESAENGVPACPRLPGGTAGVTLSSAADPPAGEPCRAVCGGAADRYLAGAHISGASSGSYL